MKRDVKRKRARKIKIGKVQINFSNKWFYTFIVIGILAIVGVGVYAWANPTTGVGHSHDEIETCADGQILQMSGEAWSCAEVASTELKTKVIEIGDWNMDTTSYVDIVHGLTFANIRSASVFIRNDVGYSLKSLNAADTPLYVPAGTWVVGTSYVTCNRKTGGGWDNGGFDSTSYNRGWITIWYEE